MTDSRLKRWSPELRRAMMKARPEYFTWSAEDQERYGVAIPEQDHERLCQALLRELSGRTIRSPKAAARAAARISLEEQHRWNETVLPLVGIGEDCFFLNESFRDSETILNFHTLRAYDEGDDCFQEDTRKNEDPTYRTKPYRGSLYLSWARLFVGRQFTYATLSMAAGYIFAALDESASALIKERIPHRYVRGKNHGKIEGECSRWDLRVDAGGQEALLEELQQQTYVYTQERYDALLTDWNHRGRRGVCLIDVSEPQENNIHFVFSDKEALAAVRFQSFLRDCRAIEMPVDELNQAAEEEKLKLATFIRTQHEELQRTFDPSVARLRKRWKIMVHKDAFEGIE